MKLLRQGHYKKATDLSGVRNRINRLQTQMFRQLETSRPQPPPEVSTNVLETSYHRSSDHIPKGYPLTPVDLPKLPFGVHESYNSDSDFLSTHFATEVSMKQSPQKKLLPRNIFGSVKAKRRGSSAYNTFDTNAGTLVCVKQRDVLQAYERDKARAVADRAHYPTLEKHLASKLPPKLQKLVVTKCTTRLYPPVHPPSATVCSKYPDLFNTFS